MADRKPLGKTLRFSVFQRDKFTCQYCGAHPPDAVLEVDHVIPVSKDGTDEMENLITACFDCNRGKRDRDLNIVPASIVEATEAISEKEAQYLGYKKVHDEIAYRVQSEVRSIEEIYSKAFPKWKFSSKFELSVKNFIKALGQPVVAAAMEKSCLKWYDDEDVALQYFCGICWNIIRKNESV